MSASEGRWLYILRCADGRYYVGSTSRSPDVRVGEHNVGVDPSAYTFTRRPVELVYCDHFPSIRDAIAAERRIKGWARAKKEALIAGRFDKLPGLSKRGPKPR